MKNLLIIIALCFSISTATGQDTKPTLEETVKYIDDIIAVSIGENKENKYHKYNVKQQKFSLNEIMKEEILILKQDNVEKSKTKRVYSNIDWSKFKEISVKREEGELFYRVELSFLSPLTLKYSKVEKNVSIDRYGNRNYHAYNDTITENNHSTNDILFYVVDSRVENLKKAFLHLKELTYKPDPFAN